MATPITIAYASDAFITLRVKDVEYTRGSIGYVEDVVGLKSSSGSGSFDDVTYETFTPSTTYGSAIFNEDDFGDSDVNDLSTTLVGESTEWGYIAKDLVRIVNTSGIPRIFTIQAKKKGKAATRHRCWINSGQTLGPDEYTITSTLPNTLVEHCRKTVLSLTETVTPSAAASRAYSDFDLNSYVQGQQPAINATRSDDCFVPKSLLTGISARTILNSVTDPEHKHYGSKTISRAGTLISPRHCIGAQHWHGQVGDAYVFVREDGSTVEANIVSRRYIQNNFPASTDVCISYLDKEVTGCTIYKVMPDGWQKKYMGSTFELNEPASEVLGIPLGVPYPKRHDLPTIRYSVHPIDSDPQSGQTMGGRMHVTALGYYMNILSSPNAQSFSPYMSDYHNFKEFTHTNDIGRLRGGDSGCPGFLPLDSGSGVELVVLGFGWKISMQSSCSAKGGVIQQAMTDLAEAEGDFTPYTLGVYDMSVFSFTEFG